MCSIGGPYSLSDQGRTMLVTFLVAAIKSLTEATKGRSLLLWLMVRGGQPCGKGDRKSCVALYRVVGACGRSEIREHESK